MLDFFDAFNHPRHAIVFDDLGAMIVNHTHQRQAVIGTIKRRVEHTKQGPQRAQQALLKQFRVPNRGQFTQLAEQARHAVLI